MQGDFRALPSVDRVLRSGHGADLATRFGATAATRAVRAALDEARAAVAGGGAAPSPEQVAEAALARLRADRATGLRPVFNLTGTVLHTNLGRALLAEAAIEAATEAMRQAVALEYDLDGGGRGERDDHVRTLICELTGAEAATVVNNNAAAVLLALNSLTCGGGGAVISRGELIEIGGAFRMPDIMARAGARLIEVGTTNRTHPRDYQAGLAEPGAVLVLKVHPSNYRIEGFVTGVEVPALARLTSAAGAPLIHDLGSGTLVDLGQWGIRPEPTVREAVSAGADLVTFSGDKLLGGPQAGFIVGRRDLVERINRNPMKRALRLDKMRLAALEATLRLYREPERLADRLPTLRLLARPLPEIRALAEGLRGPVAARLGVDVEVTVHSCDSQIGSGAMPLETLPSFGLALRPRDGSPDRLSLALRQLARPVIGRIADGALILDLRCLEDPEGFLDTLAAGAAR